MWGVGRDRRRVVGLLGWCWHCRCIPRGQFVASSASPNGGIIIYAIYCTWLPLGSALSEGELDGLTEGAALMEGELNELSEGSPLELGRTTVDGLPPGSTLLEGQLDGLPEGLALTLGLVDSLAHKLGGFDGLPLDGLPLDSALSEGDLNGLPEGMALMEGERAWWTYRGLGR